MKNKFDDVLNSASNLSKDEKKKIIEFMNKEGYDVNPVYFKDHGIGDDDLSDVLVVEDSWLIQLVQC